jgi:hypothetical protein
VQKLEFGQAVTCIGLARNLAGVDEGRQYLSLVVRTVLLPAGNEIL